MQLVIGDRFGADAQPPFAEPVSLDLSVDGTTLLNETISPMAPTPEPNGTGCDTCTNASDTLMLSGGLPNVSDGGTGASATAAALITGHSCIDSELGHRWRGETVAISA